MSAPIAELAGIPLADLCRDLGGEAMGMLGSLAAARSGANAREDGQRLSALARCGDDLTPGLREAADVLAVQIAKRPWTGGRCGALPRRLGADPRG